MIDIREKLSDVAFQNPASSGVVSADFIRELAKSVNRLMRPLLNSAGIGISDEYLVEKRIKNPINGVMQKSVANRCFVNISRLGIVDFERLITAVFLGMIEKVRCGAKRYCPSNCRENSCTSFLFFFPPSNSFHASSKIFDGNYFVK